MSLGQIFTEKELEELSKPDKKTFFQRVSFINDSFERFFFSQESALRKTTGIILSFFIVTIFGTIVYAIFTVVLATTLGLLGFESGSSYQDDCSDDINAYHGNAC